MAEDEAGPPPAPRPRAPGPGRRRPAKRRPSPLTLALSISLPLVGALALGLGLGLGLRARRKRQRRAAARRASSELPDGAIDPPWSTSADDEAATSGPPPAHAASAHAGAVAAAAAPFPPPPLAHGPVVLDVTLPLTPRELWRLVAAAGAADPTGAGFPSQLDTAFADARGDTGLVAGPWTVHHPTTAGGGGRPTTLRSRRVRYTTPLKRTWLGPSSAACDAVWACASRGEGGWAITQTVQTPGVPFGDCFHTEVLLVAVDVSADAGGGGRGGGAPPALPDRSARAGSPVALDASASAAAGPASHPPPPPGKKGRRAHGKAAHGGPPPKPRRATRFTVSGGAVFTSSVSVPGVRALITRSTADGLRESYALYAELLHAAAAEVVGARRARVRARKGGSSGGRRGSSIVASPALSGALPAWAGPQQQHQPRTEAGGVLPLPTTAAVAAVVLTVAATAVAAAAVAASAGGHHSTPATASVASHSTGWLAASFAAVVQAARAWMSS